MGQQSAAEQSILFADISGSTSLYEKIGDAAAQKRITKCLKFMEDICHKFQGVIVKHIGDEILCRFDSALQCVRAIAEIQTQSQEHSSIVNNGLHIRAGVNTGPAILTQDDVFGDTVNVAARMAGLAKADQIICTEETIRALGKDHGIDFRMLDPMLVKGKENKVSVYEILWSPQDTELTEFFSAKDVLEQSQDWSATLTWKNSSVVVNKENANITIGRNDSCDFVVPSPHASRQHAKIISRWGKIVLIDQSTNGTYVTQDSDDQVFIHREEFLLSRDGEISLGIPGADNPDDVIYLKYTS